MIDSKTVKKHVNQIEEILSKENSFLIPALIYFLNNMDPPIKNLLDKQAKKSKKQDMVTREKSLKEVRPSRKNDVDNNLLFALKLDDNRVPWYLEQKVNGYEASFWYAWQKIKDLRYRIRNELKIEPIEKYKNYLSPVLVELKDIREEQISENLKNLSRSELNFDQETGTLQIGKEEFNFSSSNTVCQFLGLFFPAGKPLKRDIYRDDIYKDIYPDNCNNSVLKLSPEKNKIYDLRRRINSKVGFELIFLKKSTGYFSLNHNY